MAYSENQTFEKVDHAIAAFKRGEYEKCHFNFCNFASANLSEFIFIDCQFNGCNLSNATLINTAFRDVVFKDCKMLGLHFEKCNSFGMSFSFDHCTLNLSSFYGLKIKQTVFKHCALHEVDFVKSDLTHSHFDHCDLALAIFQNTILEKVDFRSAYNYSLDPELNKIKKAKFSTQGIIGLLGKYDIHVE